MNAINHYIAQPPPQKLSRDQNRLYGTTTPCAGGLWAWALVGWAGPGGHMIGALGAGHQASRLETALVFSVGRTLTP